MASLAIVKAGIGDMPNAHRVLVIEPAVEIVGAIHVLAAIGERDVGIGPKAERESEAQGIRPAAETVPHPADLAAAGALTVTAADQQGVFVLVEVRGRAIVEVAIVEREPGPGDHREPTR